VQHDGTTVAEQVVELAAGETVLELGQVAGEPGIHRYRVQVRAPGDSVVHNDAGHAAVEVVGPARVLIVEGADGDAATLAAAIRAGGTLADVTATASLPALDGLSAYAAVVLVDVDARSLTPAQVNDLSATTRDLGRGLVVLGGDRSFALGGYRGSPLEEILPVVSEILDPKRKPSVAEVVAIDTSGSMAACHCRGGVNGLAAGANRTDAGGVNKTDISRAAATRTVEALSASDQFGILAFNTDQKWVVDLQALPAAEVVSRGLAGLTPAGGTDLRQPLLTAARALREAKAKLKHIILFTDGFTSPGGLEALVQQAATLAEEGITVSVLATGEGAADKLAAVAAAGRGRFYPGTDLGEIPQIMAQEATIAARSVVTEGQFYPRVTSAAAPVRDLVSAPALFGYLASTAKPAAEALLRVGDEDDPLLSSWRVGLGRVTAWTSDASARWSRAWAGWEGYVGFWSSVVRDTFPLGGSTGALAQAEVVGDRLRLRVESEQAWPDGAVAVARVAAPGVAGPGGPAGGDGGEVRLERTTPTTFAAEVGAAGPGTYAVGVSVTGPSGPVFAGTALASQSYPAEYRLGSADRVGLEQLSALAGGRGSIEPAAAFDAAGL
ncbi:MAG: glutamine amidotransferase, partial [Acidimicrobiales bacterium]